MTHRNTLSFVMVCLSAFASASALGDEFPPGGTDTFFSRGAFVALTLDNHEHGLRATHKSHFLIGVN